MKIEIYVKNRDVELVKEHIEIYLNKQLKYRSMLELKKNSKIDKLNHSLSDKDYRQILNFYIDSNSIEGALALIAKLMKENIDIRIAFKYSVYGNTILVSYDEVINFINKSNKYRADIVERLYSS